MGYLVLFSLALAQTTLPNSGRWLFAAAAAIALANLARRIARRGPLPTLATMWELGFIVIVAAEGFFEAPRFIRYYGMDAYRLVGAFVVGGFSMTMVAHALTFRPSTAADPGRSVEWKMDPQKSLVIISALSFLVLVISGPTALQMVQLGRWGTSAEVLTVSAFDSLLGGAVRGAAIVLPAMIAYHVLIVRGGRLHTAYLLAAPILLINFAIGTRFVFLISAVGLVGIQILTAPSTRMQLVKLVVVGLVLALALAAMVQFRNTGLENANLSDLVAGVTSPSVVRGENVIGVMSELVIYFDEKPHLYGKSNLGLAIFWVPRQFWTAKPTLLGYWFPRAIRSGGFSAGNSVSAGFGGDAYADFGFWGGFLVLFAYGLAFGVLDRWAMGKTTGWTDPWNAFVVVLFGLVFFAVRSPITSTIVGVGAWVWVAIYVRSAGRSTKRLRSPRRGPRISNSQEA